MNDAMIQQRDAAPPVGWPRRDPTILPGTETILVIEDDAQICALLVRGLQALGYRVYTASSGAEAIAVYAARAGSIDIVVCDVVLADMPGPVILARIGEAHPDLLPPPVLFMSGYAAQSLVEAGRLPEHSHFIQKPLLRSTVVQAIRQVLDA